MRKLEQLKFVSLVATLAFCHAQTAAVPASPSPTLKSKLTVDEVVNNLVRKNEERAQALRSLESTRIYRLIYRGFPADRQAEMTVHAFFESPDTKSFTVVAESGSKLIRERVFRKLLESEKEAARPETRSHLLLNRDNYDFALLTYEHPEIGGQYVLQVTPKSRSKYVYHGKVWVDDTDFAVTRIDAEPAQNPSFWTKRSQIHHDYKKVDGFWLPTYNESVSDIRLGGHATLTIEYKDYKVMTSNDHSAASSSAIKGKAAGSRAGFDLMGPAAALMQSPADH